MNQIVRIALADWQARTRTFAFFILAALALQFAYLFVPDAHAGYLTVSVGGTRGIYNSAWMGALNALCSVLILGFVGFYAVRGAVLRDARAGSAGIVAASPVSRIAFITGKWASNFALLGFVATVLLVGAMIMQQVRAEDRAFDGLAYAGPFVFVVLPACAVIAALAVLFDTVRPLRGVWGSVLWFFVVFFAIEFPLMAWTKSGAASPFDALGLTPLIAEMGKGLQVVFPGAKLTGLTIGVSNYIRAPRTFVWHGMTWTGLLIAERFAWTAVALGVVGLASLAFNRSADTGARKTTDRANSIGRFVPEVPGLRLLRAEASILFAESGWWWSVVAVAVGVAGLFVPQSGLLRFIVPLALLVPLGKYGSLGTRDRTDGVEELLLSAPRAASRIVAARIVAAGLIGCIPLAGAIVRLPALAVVPFAAAALAIVIGRLSGTPRAFEAMYLVVWYAGALNHAPVLDLPADALATPVMLTLVGLSALAIASVIARLQLRRF